MGSKLKLGQTGPPPMKSDRVYINPGEEDQMEIFGFRPHKLKTAIVWFFIVITVGLLRLFFHWLPHLFVMATHSKCSLNSATCVLLYDQYKQWFKSDIHVITKDGNQLPSNTPGKCSKWFSCICQVFRSTSVYRPPMLNDNLIRYFITNKVKFIWDPERDEFIRLRGLESDTPCSYFYQLRGLSYTDQQKRQVLYGINSIRVHVTPIIKILFKEVLSPFYVFQLFSMSVWYADSYEIYASCILIISASSIIITIYQTRKMQRALRNTISSSTIVNVCRGNEDYEEIPSEELVPGDIIEVPRHGCVMQCDAVLISGNCIVNESMLTGESVPITKTPLPNSQYVKNGKEMTFDMKQHARHILFSGTNVIQTRYYGNQKVKAVVIRTGFLTAKGELVRAILYPKPVDFKFNRDTYLFVGVLAFIASLGFIYTAVKMNEEGEATGLIVLRTLDLITIAVPPALPAALSVGIVFAQRRLKLGGIFCISPRGINICGTINVVCFDKTGTLTEDGLKMQGVVPVTNSSFSEMVRDVGKMGRDLIVSAMATCHSLTIIDGRIEGDPLDLIMFEATDWVLTEPGEEETRFDMMVPSIVHPKSSPVSTVPTTPSSEDGQLIGDDIGVVRQFTFSSSLQRMSVITRCLSASNFDLFAKGAPEMIVSLSKPESVPSNFQETLIGYTKHGFRVIALAWKPLPQKLNYVKVQRVTREQVEKDLIFLGLLVMENCLKPETTPTIHTLRRANIRNVMVTGDNMLTALSIARECRMVDPQDRLIMVQAFPPQDGKVGPSIEFVYADDREKKVEEVVSEEGMSVQIDEDCPRFHFAVTGRSWSVLRQFFPEQLAKIVVKGTVFARMGPEQKAQLVECLQLLGYYVGMCGDGANDCGALKTAHTGISLSEAEASVASPFTAKKPTIECVPTVIKEGRAALVTSFGIFKYMACYSLTQFVSVLLLYWIGINLTDPEFLFIDLFTLTSLSVTFGRTGPYAELVKELPPVSLLAVGPILSIIAQTAIQMAAQVFCFINVQQQPWFYPHVRNDEDDYVSYENSAVFFISSFQYITLAVTFSKGRPFRRSIFSNYVFLVNLVVCTAGAVWITVYPPAGLETLMEIKSFPSVTYALMVVGIALANFLLSVVVEMYVIDNTSVRDKCRARADNCLPSSQYKYAAIEQELAGNPSWPPVNTLNTNLASAFQRFESAYQVPKEHFIRGWRASDDFTEDGDGDARESKSFGGIDSTGPSHPVMPNSVQRQPSAGSDSGDYINDQYDTPLLKTQSSSGKNIDVRYKTGDTSVAMGDNLLTSL